MRRSSCWLVSQGVAALVIQALTVAAQDSTSTETFANMAGYTPVSDVIEHSQLDLDVLDMETNVDLLTADGMAAAYTAYSVGGNSEKTTETRTLQKFSTEAQEKLTGETYFDIWSAYWDAPDYADVFTTSACNGTGDFANTTILMRSESCLKGAQYQNVWMYVLHELEDAVNDCNNGDLTANDGGPHAWDEGWAFYAGSIEGTALGGSADGGQMLYALAEKRCENFATCSGDSDNDDTTGVSAINDDLLPLWQSGQANLLAGECAQAEALISQIAPLMAVPLIQGVLRYTYLADPAVSEVTDKESSELWAFSAAILPWIDSCDSAAATTLRNNADITLDTSPMSDGFGVVKTALESVYSCIGITCAQVGGLLVEGTTNYITGFEPCTDSDTSASDSTGTAPTDSGSDTTSETFADIAGYTPVSDVVEHSQLDLDVLDMETNVDLLTAAGMTAAYTAYSVGGNSEKTTETRTLQKFSTEAQEKLTGETYYDIWSAYWDAPDYADVFTSSACQGTGDFVDTTILMRSESCLKGAQYQNVWMYVLHELEDAVNDCNNGDLTANDGGPHAWDEGWAFYAGSIEGTALGGSADGGQMLYALAEKRCENFATCSGDSDNDDTTGVSAINDDLLPLWQSGQANLLAGECAQAEALISQIAPLMAVPLIQGVLRYTYLADPAVSEVTDKESSELWAFSAAILPWIDSCDSAAATTLRNNADITLGTSPMSDGFGVVKTALESVYSCIGITCAQVGGLLVEGTTNYITGFEPCTDSDTSASDSTGTAPTDSGSDTSSFADMAGYTPVSDVVEHSQLDLDMAEIEAGADALSETGFTAAYTAYSVGGNSEKTEEIRTIQKFSTEAGDKLAGETYYDIWSAYWGAPDYADVFTSSACNGTGDFAGASLLTRSEGCLKGAQYQNVWMYVIHELEDAVGDCNNGDLSDNDGGPHAWDEGWAFYTGSLEGTDVGGSADGGQMVYALAEKRCENFATCSGDSDNDDTTGVSAVNDDLLDLWHTGQDYLRAGDCDQAANLISEMVPLMAVPLIQGVLRYTYLADPAVSEVTDKEASELWAFSAAILPWIDSCDSAAATTLRNNADITLSTAPMSEGFRVVKAALESVYSCMGITCAQVGGLLEEGTSDYITGFEPCDDESTTSTASTGSSGSGELSAGGIAGVTIAVGAVAAIAVAGFVIFKKKKKASAVDDNLGNF
eukprot:g8009.t1